MKSADGGPARLPSAKRNTAVAVSVSIKKPSSRQNKMPRTDRSTVHSHSSAPLDRTKGELGKWNSTTFYSQKSLSQVERSNVLARLKRSPVFGKQICGDVFGTTLLAKKMEGLLYRSRMAPDAPDENRIHVEKSTVEDPILKQSKMYLESQEDDSAESDHVIDEMMTPDQRLARTLCNWSKHEANSNRTLDDDAANTLISLCASDDAKVKEDVVSGLYHLTCNHANRLKLLHSGAAAALVQVAMTTKHWRTAKLCACALGHLSMCEGGEEIMGREGAVLAVVILLGMRGHRLAQLCLHTMYNLTCVMSPYTGIERISRAILGMSWIANSEARPLILKGICNCARFPALRTRILEDGILQLMSSTLHAYANSSNNNAEEYYEVNCMAKCMRLLSDSKVTRNDMIAKGSIDVLRQMLSFSDSLSQPDMVQTLYNILPANDTQVPYPRATALQLVYKLSSTQHLPSIRHLAGLIYWLLQNEATPEDCLKLSTALQQFLSTDDVAAQTFSALACANILQQDFASHVTLSNESMPLFNFATSVLDIIPQLTLSDTRAVEAFSLAVSRICEVHAFREFMKSSGRVERIVQILLDLAATDSLNVQIYFCLSIYWLTEVVEQWKPLHQQQVASVLLKLLCCEENGIYAYAVGGIYRVVEKRLCMRELLSSVTVTRLVHIASSSTQDDIVKQTCCAILAALSYNDDSHALLADKSVMQALFKIGQDHMQNTQMTVAVCICNLSTKETFRDALLDNQVVQALASLSATGSEGVQKLCAITYCNLTCVAHRHSEMFKAGALTNLLMIALLRAVGKRTKQIGAQALLNFISGSCMEELIREGVVRAFATLSFVECEETQRVCAHAFAVLSCYSYGRRELATHRNVLRAVFGLIRCQYRQANVMLARTLCNLVAHPESKFAVLEAGALGVLRVVGTMAIQELQEDCIKVIIILAHQPETRSFVLKEDMLSVLLLYIRSANDELFERTVVALSTLSSFTEFREDLVKLGCAGAMVYAALAGKMTTVILVEECLRCLRCLSSTEAQAKEILKQNAIIALQLLWRTVSTSEVMSLIKVEAAQHVLTILKNLSCLPRSEEVLISQNSLELVVLICEAVDDPQIALASAVITYYIVRDDQMHVQVINSGIIRALRAAVTMDVEFAYFTTAAICRLTTTEVCRSRVAAQNICAIFEQLLDLRDPASSLAMAQALRHLAGSKECRKSIVNQGAVRILMALSECADEETQKACSDAMSFLSEFTDLQAGAVKVLLKHSPRQQSQQQINDSAALSPTKMPRTTSFHSYSDKHTVIGNETTPHPGMLASAHDSQPRNSTEVNVAEGPLSQRRPELVVEFAAEQIIPSAIGSAPHVDIIVEQSVGPSPSISAALTDIDIEPITGELDPYSKHVTQYDIASIHKLLVQPPEPVVTASSTEPEPELPVAQPTKPSHNLAGRSRFLKRFSRSTVSKHS